MEWDIIFLTFIAHLKNCVELDGRQHYTESGKFKDKQRTRYLNSVGITVVRFENKRVFEDVNFVLEKIQDFFKQPKF